MASDAGWSQANMMVLTELEQVRTLADPLRLRMLEAFCEERTTKQLAEVLDEKPTRLYHHVGALEGAGLIRLTRTAQNRGTTEKYYRSVARGFRADPRLFVDAGEDPSVPILAAIELGLERTRTELHSLFAAGDATALEADGLHSFVEVHTTPGRVERLREKLLAVINELQDPEDDDPGEADDGEEELGVYRLTIALFPIVGRSEESR